MPTPVMPTRRARKSGDIQGMGYVFWYFGSSEGACSRYIVGVSRFRVASFSIEDHCCYRVVVGRWEDSLIWRRAACMTRRDGDGYQEPARRSSARDAQTRSGSFFAAFSASPRRPGETIRGSQGCLVHIYCRLQMLCHVELSGAVVFGCWLCGHNPNPDKLGTKPQWVTAGPMKPTGRDGQGSTRRGAIGKWENWRNMWADGVLALGDRHVPSWAAGRGCGGASWVEKWDDALLAGRVGDGRNGC